MQGRIKQILIDIIIFSISVVIALCITTHFSFDLLREYTLTKILIIFIIGKLINHYLSGLYKEIWRYTTFSSIFKLTQVNVLFAGFLLLLNNIYTPLSNELIISNSLIITDLFVCITILSGMRISRRLYFEHSYILKAKKEAEVAPLQVKTLLVGAGESGLQVLHEIMQTPDLHMDIIGLVDDDRRKIGTIINNVKVLGATADIPKIVHKYKVNSIIICIPSALSETIRRIHNHCLEANIAPKILPGLSVLISGQVSVNAIRDISINDLLKRSPVKLDINDFKQFVDKKILVTGAGGSIGSELCRQLAKFSPREIILLGKGENSIYQIGEELSQSEPMLKTTSIIADIRDRIRLDYIFKEMRPEVIFHAAAHKHVPLMESNPVEAVTTNVFGTRNLAELADEYGVESFVLISTDKAVRSTSVMGASKRVAELIVQAQPKNSKTKFVAVRFGNVLGSRGSVIPKFIEQIKNGGPVTVTHADMTRYFMTIPEAAQLVIQASTLGESGNIFILDMGKPVKIIDLAKDLITLSGKKPFEDVDIIITGTRPGEKIHEELLTNEEGLIASTNDKIMISQIINFDEHLLKHKLEQLEMATISNESFSMRKIIIRQLLEDLKVLQTVHH